MDRRPLGLGVLLVVLLAALVAPIFIGHRIGGTAIAVAIPAPPLVGDCLHDVRRDPGSTGVAAGSPMVVPCELPHRGEIITQTANVATAATNRPGGGQVSSLAACAKTAYWYLGVHPLDREGQRSVLLGAWWPAFAADFRLLRPSPLQLRVSHSWSACVMTSPHGLVSGSAARLYGGAPRKSPIALCTATAEVVLHVSVSCNRPHATEIVGWRVAEQSSANQESVDQSCTELAARLTGRADPSAGGALRVAVVVIRSTDRLVHEGWGPGHSGPFRAACTIGATGPRLLTGSLSGIGDAPLPWN